MEPACKLPDGRLRDDHVFDASGRCECGREVMRYAPRPELRAVAPPPPRNVRSIDDLQRPPVVKHRGQFAEMRKLPEREKREGEIMPRSDEAAQAEARRESDRKRLGCKPWRPGGPGRPPENRRAVAAPKASKPKKRTDHAVSPAPKGARFSAETRAVLAAEVKRLDKERALISAAIDSINALLEFGVLRAEA